MPSAAPKRLTMDAVVASAGSSALHAFSRNGRKLLFDPATRTSFELNLAGTAARPLPRLGPDQQGAEGEPILAFRSPNGEIPSGQTIRVVLQANLRALGITTETVPGRADAQIRAPWYPLLFFADHTITTYSLRIVFPFEYAGGDGSSVPQEFEFSETRSGRAPDARRFESMGGRLAVAYLWHDLPSSESQGLQVTAIVGKAPAPPPPPTPTPTPPRPVPTPVPRPAKPGAAFEAQPPGGIVPLEVYFLNRSTGAIERHAWDFGDENKSTETSPRHVYDSPGTYTVSLTVSGPGGKDTKRSADCVVVVEDERERILMRIRTVLARGKETDTWAILANGTSAQKAPCAGELVQAAQRKDPLIGRFLRLIVYDIENNRDPGFADREYQQYRAHLVDTLYHYDQDKALALFRKLKDRAPARRAPGDPATERIEVWLRSNQTRRE